jgi:hypothetical protein
MFFFSVAKTMPISSLDAPFSSGDFADISSTKEKVPKGKPTNVPAAQQEEHDGNELFPCPVDGCVKLYQRYSALENHMAYGKCDLVQEKYTLMDQAKIIYNEKLLQGSSEVPSLSSVSLPSSKNDLSRGWALKTTKKATRFSDKQKSYLSEHFNIGQETGHKLDGATCSSKKHEVRQKHKWRANV